MLRHFLLSCVYNFARRVNNTARNCCCCNKMSGSAIDSFQAGINFILMEAKAALMAAASGAIVGGALSLLVGTGYLDFLFAMLPGGDILRAFGGSVVAGAGAGAIISVFNMQLMYIISYIMNKM